MKFLTIGVAACLLGGAVAQFQVRTSPRTVVGLAAPRYLDAQQYPPTPFEYAYSSEDVEGSHSATQSGDGNGRVQGSYTISLADGRTRTVNYVADENGYRAEVTTNELGTESKNPADVTITSSAITGEQAAIQYGPPAPQRQLTTSYAAAPAQIQLRRADTRVGLPSYGTFAGVGASLRG